jgi:hypothetical protein
LEPRYATISYHKGPYNINTDEGWQYIGTGIHAPFYHSTSSPAHTGGASIIFLSHNWQQQGYVVIRIIQGEQWGQGPFQMEIALLEAMAIRYQFGIRYSPIDTMYSDCESLANYLLNRISTRIKNFINLNFSEKKLPFLMAAQWYLQRENSSILDSVESHSEQRQGLSPLQFTYIQHTISPRPASSATSSRPNAGIHLVPREYQQ